MEHPSGVGELWLFYGFADGDTQGCFAVQRRVDALRIVIGLEVGEPSREVTAVPKQNMVEKLETDRGINGSDARVALTRCIGPALSLCILSRWDQDLRRRGLSMSLNRGIDR